MTQITALQVTERCGYAEQKHFVEASRAALRKVRSMHMRCIMHCTHLHLCSVYTQQPIISSHMMTPKLNTSLA